MSFKLLVRLYQIGYLLLKFLVGSDLNSENSLPFVLEIQKFQIKSFTQRFWITSFSFKYEDDKKMLSTNITATVAHNTNSTPPRQGNNNYSCIRRPGANTSPNNQQWQAKPCCPQRNNQQQPFEKNLHCQLCDRIGYFSRVYRSQSHTHMQARANIDGLFPPQQTPWIVDSGATHHIACDAQNLDTVHDYQDIERITIGNGHTIPIYQTGNANISASNHYFKLLNTLCSPLI